MTDAPIAIESPVEGTSFLWRNPSERGRDGMLR